MSTTAKLSGTLLMMAVLSIVLLAFSLSYPGSAKAWLAPGAHYQYPEAGGTWKYGFWSSKVRSYYIVRFSHGSSLKYNGKYKSSICTRGNKWSVATKWAINSPGAVDKYYYRLC